MVCIQKYGQIKLSGEIKRKIGVYEKTGASKTVFREHLGGAVPKKRKRITGKYLRLLEITCSRSHVFPDGKPLLPCP